MNPNQTKNRAYLRNLAVGESLRVSDATPDSFPIFLSAKNGNRYHKRQGRGPRYSIEAAHGTRIYTRLH